jgi:hypothetical protein
MPQKKHPDSSCDEPGFPGKGILFYLQLCGSGPMNVADEFQKEATFFAGPPDAEAYAPGVNRRARSAVLGVCEEPEARGSAVADPPNSRPDPYRDWDWD